jgi:tetratricopeptide (TPR) repeat protein
MSRGFVPPKLPQSAPPPQFVRPRPRHGLRNMLLISAALLCGTAGAIVYFMMARNEPSQMNAQDGAHPTSNPVVSNPTSRIAATQAASTRRSTSRPAIISATTEVELREAVAAFIKAINDNDESAVDAMFDLPREVEEMRSLGIDTDLTEQQDAQLREGWKKGYGKRLCKDQRLHLRRAETRRIEALTGPGEFRVYTHALDGESDVVVRWWLRQSGSRWRIYDYQFLTVPSLRKSRDDAFIVGTLSTNHPDWCSSSDWSKSLNKLGAGNDAATRLQTLDALLLQRFPPEYESYLLTLKGWHVMKADPKEAVRQIDAALNKYPDNVTAYSVRAAALTQADQYKDAVDSITRYIDLAGDSASACGKLGLAYEALHMTSQAADAYRRGIQCDSSSKFNREGLARTSKQH